MKMNNPLLIVLALLLTSIGGAYAYNVNLRKKRAGAPEYLTGLQLAIDAAIKAGFINDSLVIALAIAEAESDFDVNAEGDVNIQTETYGKSIGLWQIRSLKNPSIYDYPDNLRVAEMLYDPYFNAEAAYAISKSGTDFTPWTTYINGGYLSFLPGIRQALLTT